MRLTIRNEELLLLPEKALFWPKQKMLILADLHLGKAATFRAYGIAIPEGNMHEDLVKLRELIQQYAVKTCVIAGDLVHSKKGLTPFTIDQFDTWLQTIAADVHLVFGNHDHTLKKTLPANWKLTLHAHKLVAPPFVFQHYPTFDPEGFTWSGHLHPSIQLDYTGTAYKFPCFVVGPNIGILPAFSSLASGMLITPQADQQIYGIANQTIVRLHPL